MVRTEACWLDLGVAVLANHLHTFQEKQIVTTLQMSCLASVFKVQS